MCAPKHYTVSPLRPNPSGHPATVRHLYHSIAGPNETRAVSRNPRLKKSSCLYFFVYFKRSSKESKKKNFYWKKGRDSAGDWRGWSTVYSWCLCYFNENVQVKKKKIKYLKKGPFGRTNIHPLPTRKNGKRRRTERNGRERSKSARPLSKRYGGRIWENKLVDNVRSSERREKNCVWNYSE